jgi:hypothetical protein
MPLAVTGRQIIAALALTAVAGTAAALAAPASAAEGERHVLLGPNRRERQLNDLLARVSDPESPPTGATARSRTSSAASARRPRR